MATYIIGDIHGCYLTFQALLEQIDFSVNDDALWFVGDLVNNGERSADVVRWLMAHDRQCTVVLGNHDLHMLAVWSGAHKARKKDTFWDILDAPDADEMCQWLCHRPMLHQHDEHVMVHAGLHPQWSLPQAHDLAREVERHLQSSDLKAFFETMYGNDPAHPDGIQTASDRTRLTINVMTRMRVLFKKDLTLEFKFKSTLADLPKDKTPWFRVPSAREDTPHTTYFGHWSALGVHQEGQAFGLDSGCTWGAQLSAYCLETKTLTKVDAIDAPYQLH